MPSVLPRRRHAQSDGNSVEVEEPALKCSHLECLSGAWGSCWFLIISPLLSPNNKNALVVVVFFSFVVEAFNQNLFKVRQSGREKEKDLTYTLQTHVLIL